MLFVEKVGGVHSPLALCVCCACCLNCVDLTRSLPVATVLPPEGICVCVCVYSQLVLCASQAFKVNAYMFVCMRACVCVCVFLRRARMCVYVCVWLCRTPFCCLCKRKAVPDPKHPSVYFKGWERLWTTVLSSKDGILPRLCHACYVKKADGNKKPAGMSQTA